MGKTKRDAGYWFEQKIRNKEQDEVGNLRWDYTNPRCIQRLRRKNKTFYTQKMDPRTLKPIGWKEYYTDYKAKSKRNARRAAKIMVRIEAHIIMQEVWDDYWADMWSMDEDDWFEDYCFYSDWDPEPPPDSYPDSYNDKYDYYYGCDYHYRDPWDLYY